MLPKFLFASKGSSWKRQRRSVARRVLTLEPLEERSLLSLSPSLTVLAASPTWYTSGNVVTLTATITSNPSGGATPTGSVTFVDGLAQKSLGTISLASGVAKLYTSGLSVGIHQIGAVYSGDSQFQPSATMIDTQSYMTSVVGASASGDNGPATAAMLNIPVAVALDNASHLFIADSPEYAIIREVDLTSGVITTVAGNGGSGISGDGGPATAAQIGTVTGLAVDNAGHLFLADSSNSVVREVDLSSHVITTVAGQQPQNAGFSGDGGPATAAQLNQPTGLAVDSAGNFLYIADQSNKRIRKVNLTLGTPTISTIAGKATANFSGDGGLATAAELYAPRSVVLDSAGNLYIADTNNYRVREITVGDGKIKTVAGNGVAPDRSGATVPYGGDGGQATVAQLDLVQAVSLDAAGNLVIATGDNRIRRVNGSSHVITTVAGDGTDVYNLDGSAATACSIGAATGVVVDSFGNLFIAESDNYRVRKVSSSDGKIRTVAGLTYNEGGQAGAAYLDYPRAVATDSAGNLFVADASMNVVRKVNMSTGTITTVAGNGTAGFLGDGGPATAAELNTPDGLAVDAAGNLYISDSYNYRVRKVNLAGDGTITTIAGSGTDNNGQPAFAGDGGPATAAKLDNPAGLLLDGAGHLYISDNGNYVVRKVDLTSNVITRFAGTHLYGYGGGVGPATAADMAAPDGLAMDGAGNIYIADPSNYVVYKVTPGGTLSTFAGTGVFGYGGDGGQATNAPLVIPEGLAVDSYGNLFIADAGSQQIRSVNISTGVISTLAGDWTASYRGDGGPAILAELNYPVSAATDSSGHLFIADSWNHRVRELLSGVAVSVSNPGASAPTIVCSDDGGPYDGNPYPASATLTGTDNNPGPTLDGVSPTFIYYVGSSAVGSVMNGVPVSAGTYTVVAVFPGSANYQNAQSASVTFTIAKASPQLSVADAGGAYSGAAFPATVTLFDVSGNQVTSIEGVTPAVTYYSGSTASGTGTTTAPSAPGTYTVRAFFAGSIDYDAVLSDPVTFTITGSASTTIGTEIVGDGQPGFWSSSYTTWTTVTGLDGTSQISNGNNGSKASMAAWWFSMPAGMYDIAITYAPASNLTTQLGLDLYDGVGNWIGQVQVNERLAPADFTDQGVGWKRLGSFKLTNNIFHISTWNSPTDGKICIDAIELRAVPMINDTDAPGVGTRITTAGACSTTGLWAASTSGAFGNSRTSNSAIGSSSSTATWTLPVSAGSYEVDATWVAASSLSTNVTYKIFDGDGTTPLNSVSVNQRNAPGGVVDEGINWTSLGSYTIATQLKVTVTNSAGDGQVCADALRVKPAYQPTEIVNDGYPGSWYNAAWTKKSAGLFGDSLVSSSNNGSTSSQAAWWFPCRPGTYDVQVTWQAGSTLSPTVGFDIYNALSYLSSGVVNERNAPNGSTDQGVTWQSLGVFTMTSNVLHVSTWNSPADGAICIDGIRIVPVIGLSASGTSASAAAAALVENDPTPSIPSAATSMAPDLAQRLTQTQILATNLPAALDEDYSPAGTADQRKTIDPRAVDRLDLSTMAENELGPRAGLSDLDGTMDSFLNGQVGTSVRRSLG